MSVEQTRGPTRPPPTSEELGLSELRKSSSKRREQDEVLLKEGSGLSRNNLTTPNATVALLQFMNRHKCAELSQRAAIAGVDGTLASHERHSRRRNVRAKTAPCAGHLLSGHVTTARVSLCFFHHAQPSIVTPTPVVRRADVDTIATMLASFTGRPPLICSNRNLNRNLNRVLHLLRCGSAGYGRSAEQTHLA